MKKVLTLLVIIVLVSCEKEQEEVYVRVIFDGVSLNDSWSKVRYILDSKDIDYSTSFNDCIAYPRMIDDIPYYLVLNFDEFILKEISFRQTSSEPTIGDLYWHIISLSDTYYHLNIKVSEMDGESLIGCGVDGDMSVELFQFTMNGHTNYALNVLVN